MLTDGRSGRALATRCTSPIVGDTLSTSPGSTRCSPTRRMGLPDSCGAYSRQISAPRSTPTRPHAVWSCTGVVCPGPHTKLTEALARIAVEQVLAVGLRRFAREFFGEPVV